METPTLLDQLKLEEEYTNSSREKLKRILDYSMEKGEPDRTTIGRGIINHLFNPVFHNVKVEIDSLLVPKRGVKPRYSGIVKAIADTYKGRERDMYAMLSLSMITIALRATLRINSDHNKVKNSFSQMGKMLASNIMDEVDIEDYLQHAPKEESDITRKAIQDRANDYYRRYLAVYTMNKLHYESISKKFDKPTLISFGCKLLDILVNSTDYFEYYYNQDSEGRALLSIRGTQVLLDTWKENESFVLSYAHSFCPMIIEPAPWTAFDQGGYYGQLARHTKLLRLHALHSMDKYTKAYVNKLNQVDISGVLEAVNAIQATPWHIDKNVLSVVHKILEIGGGHAGIPSLDPLPNLPRLENPTKEELKAHKKKMQQIHKQELSRRGRIIRCLATVKTADKFSKYDNIYFPCNMDFRGRVYPIPSFSFQSDDLNKALLQFSNVKGLENASDIKWFYIAGANFAGIDKVSFDDRIQWVKDNHDNIMKTAEDPMAMIDFWENLDCPWESLQFCFEYKRLQDHIKETGSVVGFKTGMPIAFDGSCSGIQHYSAILRDPVGAKAVNLHPSEKPSDIYGLVAIEVNKQIDNDLIHGSPDFYSEEKKRQMIGTKTMAQLWRTYGVDRKVTKRSVMTLAYGSKEYGFKLQILEDTIYPHMGEGVFTEENAFPLAIYMAKAIWNGVQKVVTKAVEGMKWLQDVAAIICKEDNIVSWTTPMGLPIQQNYLTVKVETFKLRILQAVKRFYSAETVEEIDSRKQRQGIAPNFIHSMDASHLQFTTLMSHRRGIDHFSMIHDSYGTDLNNAGLLFKTARECFVKMYTEHDVLHEFAEEVHIYTGGKDPLPDPPAKGNFNLNEVLDSLYAFH